MRTNNPYIAYGIGRLRDAVTKEVVHILRNQPRPEGGQNYWGEGVPVDYVIKSLD